MSSHDVLRSSGSFFATNMSPILVATVASRGPCKGVPNNRAYAGQQESRTSLYCKARLAYILYERKRGRETRERSGDSCGHDRTKDAHVIVRATQW